MEFDSERFLRERFRPRERAVPVPDLAPWFRDLPEGEVPVWRVRGLEGAELARVREAPGRAKTLEALARALAREGTAERAEALREALGLGGETPDDLARRIEMLMAGSVAPRCDRQLAQRLARVRPVEFYTLTDEITRLTGEGAEPGESSGSGGTPPSEPPSPSPTAGDGASGNSSPSDCPTGG